jgi:uncharacterized membrane protein YgdD (TMEM256/DUF423 family)
LDRTFILLGSVFGAVGVILGAFGAHALREQLTAESLGTFETGVRYQMVHALALLGVAVAAGRWPASAWPGAAGWLFVAGIVLFSGSLYGLALGAPRWLGALTPFGGLALIGGWLCLALAAWQG